MQNTALNTALNTVKPLSSLEDEITELAAHLDAGQYQFLVLIGEFDARQGWAGVGVPSCAHWLNWKCGINLGAARERVRVANALPSLPKISAAFREGQVSYSKVRAMTRAATARNEDVLLMTALHGTASHVERQVRAYRRCKRLEALNDENLKFTQRSAKLYQDHHGSWNLRARLTPEQGALLKKALDLGLEQLFQEHKSVSEEVQDQEVRSRSPDHTFSNPIEARRADVLERMAAVFLKSPNAGAHGGDQYVVNIHTDIETLKKDGEGAEAELEDHRHVSAETSRRISCDASIVHWLENHKGEPLSIGRKSRTIPPAIRRALTRRDQGCRFPGCSCTRFVDAHHIEHWADGGETSMGNLVLLCRRHHRLVHEEGYTISQATDGAFQFALPDGRTLPNGPEGRFRGNVIEFKRQNRSRGLRISAETPIPAWHGEKMNLDLAVLALYQRE